MARGDWIGSARAEPTPRDGWDSIRGDRRAWSERALDLEFPSRAGLAASNARTTEMNEGPIAPTPFEGAVGFGESFADAHLHEADVLGILAEALPADVEVVLANDTPLVCAHAAVEGGRGGEGSAKVRGEIGQGWGIKP